MVKFLRKSESRGDKIARANLIHITKSINLLNFVQCLGPLICDRGKFSLHIPLKEKSSI